MNRRSTLVLLATLPLVAHSQVPDIGSLTAAVKSPLMGLLTNQLGVTESQATAGVGSYLTLAQEKLAKGDFDKLSALVPGASKYMEQAKTLGAIAGPLQNLAGLNGALGKLGISPETAAKFVPVVTDYLGKAGGGSVQKMLGAVIK